MSRDEDSPRRPLRLGVYTDYTYHRVGGRLYANRAFAVFLNQVASRFTKTTLLGRVETGDDKARYELDQEINFVELPYYSSLNDFRQVFAAYLRSVRVFWRALNEIDVAWLLGPHPFVFAYWLLARLRGRRVVLGVRQDLIEYARNRHPGRRSRHAAAWLLEMGNRLLGRFSPVVCVGPALGRLYARSKAVEVIAVSLVGVDSIQGEEVIRARDYSGELRLLSVGRLEAEKNPLLLVEILAELNRRDPRWRLTVVGEGEMAARMEQRAADLGVSDRLDLRGYVPIDAGLADIYSEAHILLHVSWTEGLPQVLLEAMAYRLPIIATDVGGIREALGEAVWLIPPGRLEEPVEMAQRLADDEAARQELLEAGLLKIQQMTLERERDRVADFIAAAAS